MNAKIIAHTNFTMKKVAILQSNYIPWRGYFDLIASVDEFIIFDDMQYTKRDWRNRNKIKASNGSIWLTIPVKVKGKFDQKIKDAELLSGNWALDHWKTINLNYKKATYFTDICSLLEPIYSRTFRTISEVNISFIRAIIDYLGIDTKISFSWDYILDDEKSTRLASLVEQSKGTHYVSGPAAKNYLIYEPFEKRNISVEWFSYLGYQEYDQLWGKFDGKVSIIDLLFNHGKDSRKHMLTKSVWKI